MKKKIWILTTLVLSVPMLMMGCSTESPTDVVNNYFTEVKDVKSDESGDLIESTISLTKEHAQDDSDDSKSEDLTKSLDMFISKVDAKVLSEKVDGEKATVKVKITGPNYEDLLQAVIEDSLTDAFDGKEINSEYLGSNLLKKVKESKSETRTGKINLVKSDGAWKIKSEDDVMNLVLGQSEEQVEYEDEIQK